MYGNLARKKAINKSYRIIMLARIFARVLNWKFLDKKRALKEVENCIRFCKRFPENAKKMILRRGYRKIDREAAQI
jgi:hypothetical protein